MWVFTVHRTRELPGNCSCECLQYTGHVNCLAIVHVSVYSTQDMWTAWQLFMWVFTVHRTRELPGNCLCECLQYTECVSTLQNCWLNAKWDPGQWSQVRTLRAEVKAFLTLELMLSRRGSRQVMRAMPAVRCRTMWWAARCIRWMSGSRAKSWRRWGEEEREGEGRRRGGEGERRRGRNFRIVQLSCTLKYAIPSLYHEEEERRGEERRGEERRGEKRRGEERREEEREGKREKRKEERGRTVREELLLHMVMDDTQTESQCRLPWICYFHFQWNILSGFQEAQATCFKYLARRCTTLWTKMLTPSNCWNPALMLHNSPLSVQTADNRHPT